MYHPRHNPHWAWANKIIDGDTFETVNGNVIRLAQVSAPEVGEPGSASATRHLHELVYGKWVWIDPVGMSYGRIVAKVWVDSLLVNLEIAFTILEHVFSQTPRAREQRIHRA